MKFELPKAFGVSPPTPRFFLFLSWVQSPAKILGFDERLAVGAVLEAVVGADFLAAVEEAPIFVTDAATLGASVIVLS